MRCLRSRSLTIEACADHPQIVKQKTSERSTKQTFGPSLPRNAISTARSYIYESLLKKLHIVWSLQAGTTQALIPAFPLPEIFHAIHTLLNPKSHNRSNRAMQTRDTPSDYGEHGPHYHHLLATLPHTVDCSISNFNIYIYIYHTDSIH